MGAMVAAAPAPVQRADGTIRMAFERRGQRTVATRLYRHGNSRISSAIQVPGSDPYYFLISTGGGFTEGEHYEVDIRVGDGAHAILTTQTPSYVYKCDRGLTTTQSQRASVGEGGLLELYCDEVMPYANAIFRQDTSIDLARGASLVLTEGLSSGWSPDAEPFRYHSAFIGTRVTLDGHLVALDRLASCPDEGGIQGMGAFEGRTNFGSVLVVDQELGPDDVQGFRECAEAAAPEGVRVGVSALESSGVVLRCLGPDSASNAAVMEAFVCHYREGLRGLAPLTIRKNRR